MMITPQNVTEISNSVDKFRDRVKQELGEVGLDIYINTITTVMLALTVANMDRQGNGVKFARIMSDELIETANQAERMEG